MSLDVSATDFCKKFGQFQRLVQREPIEVHSHGQVTGYFVSPEVFERIERITLASRRAYYPRELPGHIKDALETVEMAPEHAVLDALMEPEQG